MADARLTIQYFNDLERAYDHPERIGWVANVLHNRNERPRLVLDGGDSTALGALSLKTDGETAEALPFFEAVRPAAHVPGNHDFDKGDEWLASLQTRTPGRWLAGNVSGGETGFESTAIFERGGLRIGVVGVAHPATFEFARFVSTHSEMSCDLSADFTVDDPVETVRRAQKKLRNRNVDHVIVVSHCGSTDERIAEKTDVDMVLGGHDHERVVRTVEGTVIARTEGHGRSVIEVEFPKRAVRFLEPNGDDTDDTIAQHYRERLETAGLDEVIADLRQPIESSDVRNLVCRALREETGADVAVVPALSIRGELCGEVTRADLIGVVPFRLPTATVRMPGDSLREFLAVADDTSSVLERTVWSGVDTESKIIDAESVDPDCEYRLGLVRSMVWSRTFDLPTENVESHHAPLHELFVNFVDREPPDETGILSTASVE